MARNVYTYVATINSFDVENNPSYQPVGNETYCNYFAQDVMNHVDINAPLPTGECSAMLSTLNTGTSYPKWQEVTYQVANTRANSGYPGIAITSSHVAVVRPYNGTLNAIEDVLLAQAGTSCYNMMTLNYCWKAEDRPSIKFFSYFD